MLRDGGPHIFKGLPLGEARQITVPAVLVRLLFLQGGTENPVDLPPAFAVKERPPQSKVAVTVSYT